MAGLSVLLGVCTLGCKHSSVAPQTTNVAWVNGKAPVIYVADFEHSAESVQHETGMLSGRPGPVGRVGERLSGNSEDPTVLAQHIVDLMADSLVKQLKKAGCSASRVRPGSGMPADGWLLRGVFVEIQEGNRMRRAMIGFGQGATELQVLSRVDDLSQGQPKSLYEIAAEAKSSSKPGAAPTLVLGPYGAAARFVMAGKDLDKNVKQTAEQISAEIVQRLQQPK